MRMFGYKITPKGTKYGNRKVELMGYTFDSKKEADRFLELRAAEKAGVIKDLALQVNFELIPAQKDENGKVIERSCVYRADFVYLEDGKMVVEDAKGMRTDVYKIKRKLMLQKFGIRIRET